MEHAIGIVNTGLHKRVLVVDDDLDFSESMGEMIASYPCEVETVTTIQAARKVLETFRPELVMIDVRLGKADGASLLSDFINHPLSPLCIMMTGYASTKSAIEALKAGAYDYLTKPVSPDILFRTLDRSFERINLEAERKSALQALESRNAELEYTNKRLQRVVSCMGEISGSTSVEGLCQLLLEKVASSMGAEGGSVYLREGDQLQLAHSLDPGHAPSVIPMPLNANSILGRVMEQAEAVLISDAASSEGLMLSGWSGYRDESLLALPLVGRDGNIIGVLSLHTKQQPPFTPQDCNIGKILLTASSETLRAVKAAEELQASQAMLELIIDSVPECVKVLDKDGHILQMNKSGVQMCGAEDFIRLKGKCLYPIVKAEYRESLRELNRRVLEEGTEGKMEYALVGLRGEEIMLDTHVAPLRNTEQEIIGVLGVTRDVTDERRAMEKARQQELNLMQANKMAALGTLVAGVAHEINNPNQTIQINSGLLADVWKDVGGILDEHVRLHGPVKLGGLPYSGMGGPHTCLINDINTGAEQIRTIVDRLRTFARPYDGIHGNIEDARIQLNDAVGSALALLRHSIRKGTDNFQASLDESLPDIQGNRQQIQQIVINLVLNALESLPDKSCGIRIATRFNKEQSCVELRVRDEGVGISPDSMDQIMEPFFTTKREQGGTGLGLSIIHSLLQDQGGTIHFTSEPDKGTLVVVCLPVGKH